MRQYKCGGPFSSCTTIILFFLPLLLQVRMTDHIRACLVWENFYEKILGASFKIKLYYLLPKFLFILSFLDA
jgi:hypothetical protein